MAGSGAQQNVTSQQLQQMYDTLRLGNFDSLEQHAELKDSVYVLKRCNGFYTCSCYQGQKNRSQCKHAILCAVKQQLIEFPEAVRDPVLRQQARRGRPNGARRGGALNQR